MSNFPQNLSILRRRAGYTQETLAEALGVSRQAVGKWESGQALPEAATLLTLADLLGCTLDQLMREAVTEEMVPTPEPEPGWEDPGYIWETYYQHMRRFSLAMAFGVALILMGVAATMVACIILGDDTGLPALPVLFAVSGAVFLFVFAGLDHGSFQKSCPVPPLCPWPEEVEKFRQIFRIGLSTAVGGILLSVALVVAAISLFGEDETTLLFIMAAFMLLLALCVGSIVYLGIQYDVYDENSEERVGKKGPDVEGAIMLTATAVFLLLGFLWNKWHPGWVVFPIGGILCGIVDNLKKKS